MLGNKHLRFWCQKVLPLVYDDSLSYYEILCKITKYINDLIDQDKIFADEASQLREDLKELSDELAKWNEDSDEFFKQWMQEHIARSIFVEISEDGYIKYNIPDMWDNVTFNTTGLDIFLEIQPNYGHLVLSY